MKTIPKVPASATLEEFVRASCPEGTRLEDHVERTLQISWRYYRRLRNGTRGTGVPIYIGQLDQLARDRGEVVTLRLPQFPPMILGLPSLN